MSESAPWQPPAGGAPARQPDPYAPPGAVPGPAPYVPPGATYPPAVGSPYAGPAGGPYAAPPPPGAGGWTPPPKPGLIPLRPLTLGTILGGSFQVLRRNPKPTFGFALLVTGVTYLIGLGVVGLVVVGAAARMANATGADADAVAAGSFGIIALSALIPVGLALVGGALLQGVVSLEVARGTVGEKLKLRGLLRRAKGRIGPLIGWSLAIAGTAIVAYVVVVLVLAAAVGFGGVAGAVVAVILGLILGLGAVVLVAWLSTKLSLVPSVLMLERLPLGRAIARSWTLTNGVFWKTFGIQLLVLFILNTATSVVSLPLNLLSSYATILIDPTGGGVDAGAVTSGIVVVGVLSLLLTTVIVAVAAVVQAAVAALIYIDIRMRKEGLDLDLSRYVEAKQAGDESVADPYLAGAAGRGMAQPQPAPSGSPWA